MEINNWLKGSSPLGVLLLVAGCATGPGAAAGPSEEGRAFIIDACADVYQKDWSNTSIDSLVSYENDFIQIKNRATGLDDASKAVIGELANEASKLTDLNAQWWRDMPSDVIENVDQVIAATDKLEEGRAAVGDQINSICAPFFN